MTDHRARRKVDGTVNPVFREEDTIKACVLRVCGRGLLVCDLCTLRELLIQTPDAAAFRPGERVRIEYSGTVSVAGAIPQIGADQICCVRKW